MLTQAPNTQSAESTKPLKKAPVTQWILEKDSLEDGDIPVPSLKSTLYYMHKFKTGGKLTIAKSAEEYQNDYQTACAGGAPRRSVNGGSMQPGHPQDWSALQHYYKTRIETPMCCVMLCHRCENHSKRTYDPEDLSEFIWDSSKQDWICQICYQIQSYLKSVGEDENRSVIDIPMWSRESPPSPCRRPVWCRLAPYPLPPPTALASRAVAGPAVSMKVI